MRLWFFIFIFTMSLKKALNYMKLLTSKCYFLELPLTTSNNPFINNTYEWRGY